MLNIMDKRRVRLEVVMPFTYFGGLSTKQEYFEQMLAGLRIYTIDNVQITTYSALKTFLAESDLEKFFGNIQDESGNVILSMMVRNGKRFYIECVGSTAQGNFNADVIYLNGDTMKYARSKNAVAIYDQTRIICAPPAESKGGDDPDEKKTEPETAVEPESAVEPETENVTDQPTKRK